MTEQHSVTPTEAGFDGAKGIRFPTLGPTARFLFRRSKTFPSGFPMADFKEQMVWLYPKDKLARLLWCNADDQWFELSFTPINKP